MQKSFWWKTVLAATMAASAWGGTFGTVVPIGGEASDLALDETRGVLYIADFTGNRIDVMSLATNTIQTSINTAAQPNSIALSPDGHYLVATNFGNNAAPGSPSNSLTVIDLTTHGTQTFALGNPPLGVAFGADGIALVVTTTDFLLFDPSTGATQELDTLANVVANTLPAAPANFPGDISAASVAASSDGLQVFGLGGSTSTVTFRYDVNAKAIFPGGIVTSTGVLGPRVVSLNHNGSLVMAGWVMLGSLGFVNYFPQHDNEFSVGTTAFDDSRGLLYAQIPEVKGDAPTLMVVSSANLALQQRLQLAENLSGKSVLSSDSNTLYAASASGVTVLPVGSIDLEPRVLAQQEDLVFRGSICSPGVATQRLTVVDPGGNNTPFTITSDTPGVSVSPAVGVTPAILTVSVDPSAFLGTTGTVAAHLNFSSNAAVNVIPSVRVLVNNAGPNQVGSFIDIPGNLTDIVTDPKQGRFFVVRQDKNEVLVYDAKNYQKLATLPTGNQPVSMAISFDQQYLLVGHQGSQLVDVFDLDTLQPDTPIVLPSGFIALSIASSARATLAQAEFFDGTYHILQLDIPQRTGSELPSLGVFKNVTNANTVMTASPNGSTILIAQADGTVYLYDASSNSFTVSRQDFTSLAGPYAASSFNQYVVGNHLLNSSLVPVRDFETGTGSSSGFAFVNQTGFRTNAPIPAASPATGTGSTTTSNATASTNNAQSTAPGVIERFDMTNATSVSAGTAMVEAPLLGNTASPFTRTVAPLADQSAIVNLTVSGVTVLPWSYNASVAPPQITAVVNAGNGGSDIAPGGLISVYGQQLSPVNMASSEIPLPTALANSCLSVNGLAVPILFVSPNQVNAQMPYQAVGDVTLILRTPGGQSDNYNLLIQPNAPSVFLSAVGPNVNVASVVRDDDNELISSSHPIHRRSDTPLTIYLTGLGPTSPAVGTGQPGPVSPLAVTLTQPTVSLGGVSLPVLFSGLAPGLVGVDQINVSVPFTVPNGMSVPLVVTQGGVSTTIPERVVD
ncbi:MAG TPA: hypothetical protein VFW44_11320 [Bryobacteraceae bacterium]|nr:hypothetical protein [Bryobacteraceae bacterium]